MAAHDIDNEIKGMLNPGEQVLLVASQARAAPGGSISTPNKIYITNMRVIYKDPKLFGLKADIIDLSYKDISNVRLRRGVFSTDIFLKSRFLSDEIDIPAVDKHVAQQAMAMIQSGIRGELPGQSGVVGSSTLPTNKGLSDPISELERIGDLKQKGLLSEDEYQALKADLLKKMRTG